MQPTNTDSIDLKLVSKALSQKIGEQINIQNIEKAGSGYHSDGFKLTASNGKHYFIKKVKSHDLGFEIPERKVNSLLVGHGMANRVGLNPQPIGLIIKNGNELTVMPELNDDSSIYHIQEFESEGISYWDLLQKKKDKIKVNEQDIKELSRIIDFIAKVHEIKPKITDIKRLKAIYNDGIRSVLSNPELTFTLLQEFSNNHSFFPIEKQKEYLGLMLQQMHKWKDRYDRISALHGDFWGANVFFRKDGSVWVIDFSRIPWGDAGIDIGWFVSQYLMMYYKTKNTYFKELGEKFINMYKEKTGDSEIESAVCLILGLMGIIYTTPCFYPDLDPKLGTKILNNVERIMMRGKLIWTEQ